MREMAASLALLVLTGCTAFPARSTLESLSGAILNQDDPEIVCVGAPAYLLLLDGLIAADPENRRLLYAAAELYSVYAAAFIDEELRAKRLTEKGRGYARRALCLDWRALCEREQGAYDRFVELLPETGRDDLPVLYAYGTSWAAWIGQRSDRWDALADLPKVEAVLERILALDEGYGQGSVHLYLGILRSRLPPALGGKPEVARAHFERAIALSGGRNLKAKVELAKRYARMVYDRALHDRLLNEVLAADIHLPGFVLTNALAQQEARRLLEASEAYFFKE